MTMNEKGRLTHEDQAWVKEVPQLANKIGQKLSSIGFLRLGVDDNISHHLAEVAYICSDISSRIVPRFLSSEGAELQDTSVDLFWDLREMKEAIESMEADLQRLMNHINP